MKHLRLAFACALATGALASLLGSACGAFSEPPATEDGGAGADGEAPDAMPADGEPPEAASDALVDATLPPFDLEVRPACPRPAASPDPCTGLGGAKPCVPDVLYSAPTPMHVFGVAADRRHVYWLAQPRDADAGSEHYNGKGPAILYRLDRATKEVVELARDEHRAVILLAFGAHLFWASTETPGSGTYRVRMLRKDAAGCTPFACSPAINLGFGLSQVMHMGALATDAVFTVEGNGTLRRITTDAITNEVIGGSTDFPAFTVGDGVVYLGGGQQKEVERYGASGAQRPSLGGIPDAGLGGLLWLATSCSKVFARGDSVPVFELASSADGGTFTELATVPSPFLTYAAGTDARFLYYGAANGSGLVRIEHTTSPAAVVKIAGGSVWGIAVTDDAVIYGEHGSGPGDTSANVGSIYSIAK